MPPSGGWRVRISAELAGAETKMKSVPVCVVGDMQLDQKTPVSQEDTGEQYAVWCVCKLTHRQAHGWWN